jgi:hypothetical protein
MRPSICIVPALIVCAVSAAQAPPEKTASPVLLLKGWVQANGEIRIYAHHRDLGQLYDGSCTSGVMTRSRTLPDSLQNRYVAVYGSWMSAGELEKMAANLVSIGVENYCSSARIAIIERVVPLKSPGAD